MTDSSSVSADLASLESFSTDAHTSLMSFISESATILSGIGVPMIGINNTISGALCRLQYFQTFDQLGGVLGDVMKGGTALSAAARTIGVHYSNGDMDAAAQLKVVGEAFAPTGSQQSTAQMYDADKRADAAKAPTTTKNTANALPAATNPAPPKASTLTAGSDDMAYEANMTLEVSGRYCTYSGEPVSEEEYKKDPSKYLTQAEWENQQTVPKQSSD